MIDEVTPTLDETPSARTPIIVESYFAASPERVFAAWTDPNIVRKWFGPAANSLYSAVIELREGGAWRFVESQDEEKSIGFEGQYLHIEAGKRLVFTWSKFVAYVRGEPQSTPYSQVEVTFTKNGDGTDVRLVHSAIHDQETHRAFHRGWARALDTMSALLS